MMPRCTISSGFTLLELLIAIAIFAFLTMSAYQVVDGVRRTEVISKEHSTRLIELQKSMQYLQRDLGQMLARKVRSDFADPEPVLLVGNGLLGSDSMGIRVVRSGLINPQMQLPRSQLLRVGYRIKDQQLQRLVWPVVDAPSRTEPTVRTVLHDVQTMKLAFYNGKRWQDNWDDANTLPQALRLTLTLADRGDIERIWLLGNGIVNQANPNSAEGSE
ncbi:MAG: type II secretion system minor pseudopilin GspJ [Plesiomonas sp.]|uniref:type II secretion system minor pseudopilin GspJ n=1 Tax=Plesiomonas sp. TaxID=2486279 RepID=UPI003F3F8DC4